MLTAVVATFAFAAMKTPWTDLVSPTLPHPEYPRPQMVRKEWTNLNGKWDFAVAQGDAEPVFNRKILVPFPVESQLSGIGEMVPSGSVVWYRRPIQCTKPKGRVLLHFGAVDWHAKVFLDDDFVGEHKGGYTPFSFEVTSWLKDGKSHTLKVKVIDPTDSSFQPRGKQVRKPEGIWYTPTTGIWQTVWMESVPENAIQSLYCTTKMTGEVTVHLERRVAKEASVEVRDGRKLVAKATGKGPIRLKVAAPKLWSPDKPFLYSLRVKTGEDTVDSYLGIREFGKRPNASGQPVLTLNGQPIFMLGPLDQGFWPDGLYTPPTEEAMVYDLQVTKGLGFNTIRKHVKVEGARWYAACDRLGIIVWQDMPSGDSYIGPRDKDITRTQESGDNYQREWTEVLRNFRFFPCIGVWVPFNEGWGQWRTEEVAAYTKKYDPTRLVNSASGWTDRGIGDMHDIHVYPGPSRPPLEKKRAIVLGEFGGLGFKEEGHTWLKEGWGYRSFDSKDAMMGELENIFAQLRVLRTEGLSAAIYTQTTDVEVEVNGLMTYDRQVMKVDAARFRKAVRSIYGPEPRVEVILQTSEKVAQEWRYTNIYPPDQWTEPGFDDAHWTLSKGGFGTQETPAAVVGTRWEGAGTIWLRRKFVTSALKNAHLSLRIHHDEDAEVYLDGKKVFEARGWTSSYRLVPLKGLTSLTAGEHTLAVKCTQNWGGQFIDVGLVEVK